MSFPHDFDLPGLGVLNRARQLSTILLRIILRIGNPGWHRHLHLGVLRLGVLTGNNRKIELDITSSGDNIISIKNGQSASFSMNLRYDPKKRLAVCDITEVEIEHSVGRSDVSHGGCARYSRSGLSLYVHYYYFNKNVVDITAFGPRPTRRPYRAIIPTSPNEFWNFSSLFLKINGKNPSQEDYRDFLDQLSFGLLLCFRAKGDWDEYLKPYEVEIMDWREANLYVSNFPSE